MLVVGGCGAGTADGDGATKLDLTGKKVVMIIAPEKFRDEELFEPKELLEAAGATVKIASTSLEEATGMRGGKAKADLLLADVKVAEYDAIVFIGGSGASVYWDDATAHAIAVEAAESGKVLGAICIAPVTLAKAGVLDKKKATVYKSERSKLEAAGAKYTGAAVEVDGNIITADGPSSAKAFGQALAEALAKVSPDGE
jgi:protease I